MGRRLLILALALIATACGGMVVRQEFSARGQPLGPGQPGPGPVGPNLVVANDQGDSIQVAPYTWASETGVFSGGGSGPRTPEQFEIDTVGLSVTMETPFPEAIALVTPAGGTEGKATGVVLEAVGERVFALHLPASGMWVVDVFSLGGSDYGAFAFTVFSE